MVSTTIFVLLALAGLGEGLKCYYSFPPVAAQEKECEWSCQTTTSHYSGYTYSIASCSGIQQDDKCVSLWPVTTCYCNTDLCNNDSSSSPIGIGNGPRCYVGVQGTSVTELQCSGSCLTSSGIFGGQTQRLVSCVPIKQADKCVTVGQMKMCYCNTNLCNKGSSSGTSTELGNKGSSPGQSGTSGEWLKCYVGMIGVSVSVNDCAGSCATSSVNYGGQKYKVASCVDTKQADECKTAEQLKICYCNTDLCNTGSSSGAMGISGMRGQLTLYFLCMIIVIGKLL